MSTTNIARGMAEQLGDMIVVVMPCDLTRVGGDSLQGTPGLHAEMEQLTMGSRRAEENHHEGGYMEADMVKLTGITSRADYSPNRLVIPVLTDSIQNTMANGHSIPNRCYP